MYGEWLIPRGRNKVPAPIQTAKVRMLHIETAYSIISAHETLYLSAI